MSKLPELESFIKEAFKIGQTESAIKEVLTKNGWDEKIIDENINRYALGDFPIAVPKPKIFVSARLFFMNLFYFMLLYVVIASTLYIYFDIIDFYIPDNSASQNYYSSQLVFNTLKTPLSYLALSIPLAFFTRGLIEKAMAQTKQSIPKIRLFLIYLTLTIGACVMFFTGCWLVVELISGGLTLNYTLKILAMGITVALLYYYFRADLQHEERNA